MKTLPKTIYVSLENPGTDDEFFAVHKNQEDHAEPGKVTRVGEYKLVKQVELTSQCSVLREVG